MLSWLVPCLFFNSLLAATSLFIRSQIVQHFSQNSGTRTQFNEKNILMRSRCYRPFRIKIFVKLPNRMEWHEMSERKIPTQTSAHAQLCQSTREGLKFKYFINRLICLHCVCLGLFAWVFIMFTLFLTKKSKTGWKVFLNGFWARACTNQQSKYLININIWKWCAYVFDSSCASN